MFDNLFTVTAKSKCRITSPSANETLHPNQFFAAGNRYEDGSSVRSCDVIQEMTVEAETETSSGETGIARTKGYSVRSFLTAIRHNNMP